MWESEKRKKKKKEASRANKLNKRFRMFWAVEGFFVSVGDMDTAGGITMARLRVWVR